MSGIGGASILGSISLPNLAFYGTAAASGIYLAYITRVVETSEADFEENVMYASYGPQPASATTPEAAAAHKAYKEGSCKPKNWIPDPKLSVCEGLVFKINKVKECQADRQAWDDQFWPGRHADAIAQVGAQIANLQKLLVQKCMGL
jgi:hypothetical protein